MVDMHSLKSRAKTVCAQLRRRESQRMRIAAAAIGDPVTCYRREIRQLLGEGSRRERTGPAPLIHGLLRSRGELAELHQPFVALLHQRVGRAVAEFV